MTISLKLNHSNLDIIKNKNLIKTTSYVNGKWLENSSDILEVTNPALGSKLIDISNINKEQIKYSIDSAHKAFIKWKNLLAKERSAYLHKWFRLIMDNADDLANIMVLEQGKPFKEALGEIKYGAAFVEWFAEEGKRIKGELLSPHLEGKKLLTYRHPVGVVGAITPWNFPTAMITRKVAPAIAAGCTVVIKPASETPLSALALAALAEEAGFPEGVINVIIGHAKEIGSELTSNPIVKKISFTGSTAIGKLLLRQSADTVKRTSMELGGNAPFIIFNDADLDLAIKGAIASKFRNSGQTCICANRILVQEEIKDKFIEKFVTEAKKMILGSGLEPDVSQGPLINYQAIDKLKNLINDAKNHGAIIHYGGEQVENTQFFLPTIISNLNSDMQLYCEEIFGPIAAIWSFKDEKEALKIANDTNYGLASYFYTRDYQRIWRVSEQLEYGMVGVNEGLISTEIAPFGGVKESGMGREGATQGISEYLDIKYVCIGLSS